MLKLILYTSLSLAAMAFAVSLGGAQQATFKRTELQRGDLSISGQEAVQSLAEIPSGVASGRHTHPGEEVGYILEGTVVMESEGKPPVTLKAGDVFLIPAGHIHNARNIGTETSKMLSTYIVEKGKPLATPVP
jgi:quercetin dioxygenase-like cupin family protein